MIAALAEETATVDRRAVAKRLGLYAFAVLPLSAAAMVLWLHLRPDLAEAVFSGFFWVKLGYALALALTGFLMAERLSRPAAPFQRPAASAVRVIIGMAVWGTAALYLTPAPERLATWLG
ncbi:NrsF family protein, partial [Pseudomonas sivasensis]|uniref:NrsF family protein n=1 Tax=Pseudomonas sivasensis TaxID=1880678 RepID=UPI0030DB2C34